MSCTRSPNILIVHINFDFLITIGQWTSLLSLSRILGLKSLYISCDMVKYLTTTILHLKFEDKAHLLPSNIISASNIQSLISFCLGNFYFEFNGNFYSHDTEVTIGYSCGRTCRDNSNRRREHLSNHLNSKQTLPTLTDILLTKELETSVIDLMRMDSTSFNRKPTHTHFYDHCNSCADSASLFQKHCYQMKDL